MRQAGGFLFVAAALVLLMPFGVALARQEPSGDFPQQDAAKTETATLRVCLRLEDETVFLGRARVRLTPNEGRAVENEIPELLGEARFPEVRAGKYEVEVNAVGYEAAPVDTDVGAGVRQRTLYMVMRPRTVHLDADKSPPPETKEKTKDETRAKPPGGASLLLPSLKPNGAVARNYWMANELEAVVPPVDASVACPTEKVLQGVGERMEEFTSNLERFAATEVVEHYVVSGEKLKAAPDSRKFDYVVTVSQNRVGTFLLEEYRNGEAGPEQFPAHVATLGLPAMALLFHPQLATDFNFVCEGLGEWGGRPAWQVHFAQKDDRPVRMRAYVVNGRVFDVRLDGRAWIDPGSFQVMRMESELMAPIPQIELTAEHIAIEYEPVQFRTQKIQIWLPRQGELYVERRGHRYYRKHTFSDFQVFNVDTSQNIQAPKESYSFTNTSDRDIAGVLTVVPLTGATDRPITLKFTVPARGRVFKVVGPGKDVNLPVTEVRSATFAHNGGDGSIKVDANLARETTLDVIPGTAIGNQ
jgi:hypothetical protein